MSPLTEIHAMIDARVRAIREDRPDWWCGKGCDTCCRRLAELPRLTAAEWELLRDGLAALSPQRLDAIGRDLAALANDRARPLVCPLGSVMSVMSHGPPVVVRKVMADVTATAPVAVTLTVAASID